MFFRMIFTAQKFLIINNTYQEIQLILVKNIFFWEIP